MRKLAFIIAIVFLFPSCKNDKQEAGEKATSEKEMGIFVGKLKKELEKNGFKTFDYVDENSNDTILMQQYFIAFLKKGPIRAHSTEKVDSLQKLHLDHLGRMYREGYADISGPFGDDGDIRGITIYNVPTLEMADSLARLDPMVKSGRMSIEIHPWWAAKGFRLR